jgi:hypothetical protein
MLRAVLGRRVWSSICWFGFRFGDFGGDFGCGFFFGLVVDGYEDEE